MLNAVIKNAHKITIKTIVGKQMQKRQKFNNTVLPASPLNPCLLWSTVFLENESQKHNFNFKISHETASQHEKIVTVNTNMVTVNKLI